MAGTTEQLREEGAAAAQVMMKLQGERETLGADLQRAVGRVRSLEEELESSKMAVATLTRAASSHSLESVQFQ